MTHQLRLMRGTVTSPKGFLADGLWCGIKKSRKKDFAIIVSLKEATAAGMFTQNKFRAAPVILTQKTIATGGKLSAVVINSGNANACTGAQGHHNAAKTQRLAAKTLNVKAERVAVCSTGVIGAQLPMTKIVHGLKQARPSARGGTHAAEAIRTTDWVRKERAVRFKLGKYSVCIGGIAKGAGMIHPDMATMIAVLSSDAALSRPMLSAALKEAVGTSFNAITVDGDESTNDTVLCLANGMAGHPVIRSKNRDYRIFVRALKMLCEALAKDIVRDGEGATKVVELIVDKVRTESQARAYANAIAKSSLVKTAIYGEDPNWGRIAAAIGSIRQPVRPDKIEMFLNDCPIVKKGMELTQYQARAKRVMKKKEFQLKVRLNNGSHTHRMWMCDMTHDYIRINASYRS